MFCQKCSRSVAIHQRYPPPVRAGQAAEPPLPLPAEPTTTRPGSEAKLLALEARAAVGVELFRADDGQRVSGAAQERAAS
jgi:hypothetical protein